jgi:hypothetical protein
LPRVLAGGGWWHFVLTQTALVLDIDPCSPWAEVVRNRGPAWVARDQIAWPFGDGHKARAPERIARTFAEVRDEVVAALFGFLLADDPTWCELCGALVRDRPPDDVPAADDFPGCGACWEKVDRVGQAAGRAWARSAPQEHLARLVALLEQLDGKDSATLPDRGVFFSQRGVVFPRRPARHSPAERLFFALMPGSPRRKAAAAAFWRQSLGENAPRVAEVAFLYGLVRAAAREGLRPAA